MNYKFIIKVSITAVAYYMTLKAAATLKKLQDLETQGVPLEHT